MVIVTPAVQINAVNAAATPQNTIIAQTSGQSLSCLNGANLQEITLPTATSAASLSFPSGVTTAVFIFIAALTTTDLIVTLGGTVAVPIPARLGVVLYGLTSGQITVSTAAGGQIQYCIGG